MLTKKERWLAACGLIAAVLPFVLTCLTIQMLPPIIILSDLIGRPVSEVSRYNNLFIGLFCVVPFSMVFLVIVLKHKNYVNKNFTAIVVTSLILSASFLVFVIYGLVKQARNVNLIKDLSIEAIAGVIFYFLIACLACMLPDIKQNNIIGLRNKYTLKSAQVWQKVHYDCSIVLTFGFTLCAAALAVLSFLSWWAVIVFWVLSVFAFGVWIHGHSSRVYARLGGAEQGAGDKNVPQA